MRKSVSLAEESPVAVDTSRVGVLGEKNHSLDTSCQAHNGKPRNDLAPTSLRVRRKKSSVSSFVNSSRVPSELGDQGAERRKKFSLCTGSSYDSQLSLGGVEQLQLQEGDLTKLQGAVSRQRKLSLVSLSTSNQASALSSPKVQQYFTNHKIGDGRCGARTTINRGKAVQ